MVAMAYDSTTEIEMLLNYLKVGVAKGNATEQISRSNLS